ncbi:DUF5047 domain-containing protein [Streptomyces sp. DW26H14]|uniref:DUF5047 domain-containing protein n=1 Tax=Streptomyces sp. DW26H14 TaxID=3435395 RepID=UPI00403E09FB
MATRVDLFLTDGTVQTLDHTGGSVTADRGQSARRTCTCTLADLSLIPRTPMDKLNVYGSELLVSRGIQFRDGAELAPIGRFRVDSVTGDPDIGPVTISGTSLEAFISDDPLTAPTTVHSATQTAVGGITQLIQETLPDAVVISRVTDQTVGTITWDQQQDRWAAVQELATAIGAEVYCDAAGQFIIADLPDLTGDNVVWAVEAGEGGAYISADRGMSREKVYNSVTAYGENTADDTAPVQATVEDTDPTSPTYVDGPFGRVPTFYNSATLTSVELCTSAAAQLLSTSLRPNASADITSLPNPLLEPGDVIRVVYGDGSRELHQIQSFTISLDTSGGFTLATISAKEDS